MDLDKKWNFTTNIYPVWWLIFAASIALILIAFAILIWVIATLRAKRRSTRKLTPEQQIQLIMDEARLGMMAEARRVRQRRSGGRAGRVEQWVR